MHHKNCLSTALVITLCVIVIAAVIAALSTLSVFGVVFLLSTGTCQTRTDSVSSPDGKYIAVRQDHRWMLTPTWTRVSVREGEPFLAVARMRFGGEETLVFSVFDADVDLRWKSSRLLEVEYASKYSPDIALSVWKEMFIWYKDAPRRS